MCFLLLCLLDHDVITIVYVEISRYIVSFQEWSRT
jgi:hypothetical protein